MQDFMESVEIETSLGPVGIYRALDADILLENVERGWDATYVASNPVDSFRYSRVPENGNSDGSSKGLELLRDWLDSLPSVKERKGVPDVFGPGAFGYVGYDVAKELEEYGESTVRDFELPDIAFDFYDTVVRIGKSDGSVVIDAVEHPNQTETVEERIERTRRKIEDYENHGTESYGDGEMERYEDGEARGYGDNEFTQNPKTGIDIRASDVKSNFEHESYLDAVKKVKKYIRVGDTFQANISQRLSFVLESSQFIESIDVYERLRKTNPGPYMGLLDYSDSGSDSDDEAYSIISSSPELLVRKRHDTLVTRPIAGTRPRGKDNHEDQRLKRELEVSEKERAEHSILVDLVRNDLGGVSEYGTVEVEEFMSVEPYAEVQHLESIVTGKPRTNSDVVDVLSSMFPGGTVTGAPKPRTLEIIEEVEPTERGPYTGSMGRVGVVERERDSRRRDFEFNILIRSIVRDGDDFHLQVGGGVVHDSDPEREYVETLHKARGSMNSLGFDVDELVPTNPGSGGTEGTETNPREKDGGVKE